MSTKKTDAAPPRRSRSPRRDQVTGAPAPAATPTNRFGDANQGIFEPPARSDSEGTRAKLMRIRLETLAHMSDCRAALTEADGDADKAIRKLRSDKASRAAAGRGVKGHQAEVIPAVQDAAQSWAEDLALRWVEEQVEDPVEESDLDFSAPPNPSARNRSCVDDALRDLDPSLNYTPRYLACSKDPMHRIAAATQLEAHEVLFLLSDPEVKVRYAAVQRCLRSPVLSALLITLGWQPFSARPELQLEAPSAARILREALNREVFHSHLTSSPYHSRAKVGRAGLLNVYLKNPLRKVGDAISRAAQKLGRKPRSAVRPSHDLEDEEISDTVGDQLRGAGSAARTAKRPFQR